MNITFERFFSRKVETKPGDFDVEIMKIEPITSNFVQTQLKFYFNKKKHSEKLNMQNEKKNISKNVIVKKVWEIGFSTKSLKIQWQNCMRNDSKIDVHDNYCNIFTYNYRSNVKSRPCVSALAVDQYKQYACTQNWVYQFVLYKSVLQMTVFSCFFSFVFSLFTLLFAI